ncbi:hypothetical protein JKP88DRAFT_306508 [Tribonema minus]|uniref:Pentatricopeptide repeat-containing protein n=1 Tax=Tribonema minus TaxID=303371 RepID=A0A835Z7A9_9STRA|nr:hypothetical protein JKP88DRAFT_306508 [Tribonema minus]
MGSTTLTKRGTAGQLYEAAAGLRASLVFTENGIIATRRAHDSGGRHIHHAPGPSLDLSRSISRYLLLPSKIAMYQVEQHHLRLQQHHLRLQQHHLRLQQEERLIKGSEEAGRAVVEAATAATAARLQKDAHIRALVAEGRVQAAVSALHKIVQQGHQPDIEVFHLVLEALSTTRSMPAALTVMSLLRRSGTPPDRRVYTYALRTCGGAQSAQKAGQLLRGMMAAGLKPDKDTFGAALMACGPSNGWQRALDLFAEVGAAHPRLLTVHAWNRLLAVLIDSGKPECAVAKAAEMAERGLTLNADTYAHLLGAYALLGDHANVEKLAAGMCAKGAPLTAAGRYRVVRGYAMGGHLQRAEDALEAAIASGDADPTMVIAMLRGCRDARDLPRTKRWLQRSLSLGLATASAWHLAVGTAHAAGDAGAADALWRDAEAAGAPSLYKAMRTLRGGCGRAVDVNQPSLLRRPHASAPDLSRCDVGVAHAAARAAARDLRRAPPPAVVYIYTGHSNPKQDVIARAVTAIMLDAGAHVSKESGRGAIWKAEMRK